MRPAALVPYVPAPARQSDAPNLAIGLKCLRELAVKLDGSIEQADDVARMPLEAARARVAAAVDEAGGAVQRTATLEAALVERERDLAEALRILEAARRDEADLDVSDDEALEHRDAAFLAGRAAERAARARDVVRCELAGIRDPWPALRSMVGELRHLNEGLAAAAINGAPHKPIALPDLVKLGLAVAHESDAEDVFREMQRRAPVERGRPVAALRALFRTRLADSLAERAATATAAERERIVREIRSSVVASPPTLDGAA
jgi:hypothetical protein